MSYYFTRQIGAAAALSTLLAGSAAAFSISSVTASSPNPSEIMMQNVRWVCDQYGRCYHERGYGYYRRHYYDSEPGYGYGPDYTYGPSFSFSFGRGHHHHDDEE